jgi:hypothetical protein
MILHPTRPLAPLFLLHPLTTSKHFVKHHTPPPWRLGSVRSGSSCAQSQGLLQVWHHLCWTTPADQSHQRMPRYRCYRAIQHSLIDTEGNANSHIVQRWTILFAKQHLRWEAYQQQLQMPCSLAELARMHRAKEECNVGRDRVDNDEHSSQDVQFNPMMLNQGMMMIFPPSMWTRWRDSRRWRTRFLK